MHPNSSVANKEEILRTLRKKETFLVQRGLETFSIYRLTYHCVKL